MCSQWVYLFVLVDHLFVYRFEFQSPPEEDLVEKWVLVLGYRLQIDASIFDASMFRHHLVESRSLQSLSARGRLLLHSISR